MGGRNGCQHYIRNRGLRPGSVRQAIDAHLPIGPTAKTMLDVLMTETASHVGTEELRGSGLPDANRFVVKLALGTLTERYSRTLILSLS